MLAGQLQDLQQELSIDLKFFALQSKIYYNKKQSGETDLEVGELKLSCLRKISKQQEKAAN